MAGNRSRRGGSGNLGSGLANNARRTLGNRRNRIDAATRAASEGRDPNTAGRARNKVSGDRGTRNRRNNRNNRNR